MEQPLMLKYQKDYSIIINDIEHSLYYYFDYGERFKGINMEFQHSHVFHEMMILLSPAATHLIEGVPYSLEEGDIILLRPSLLHKSEYPSGPPSKRLIINFWFPRDLFGMEEYYTPLLQCFQEKVPIFRFPKGLRDELFAYLDEIYSFSMSHSYARRPEDRLMIHTLFLQFLYRLNENSANNIYTQKPSGLSSTKKIYDIVYYIHTHYSEDLSLDSLAKRFYLSSCYLSHQFKKVTGFTLINYIQRTRISKAKDMLLSTNHSISTIAQASGFQSFSQFNRIFRQVYQESPSAMRSASASRSQYQTPFN